MRLLQTMPGALSNCPSDVSWAPECAATSPVACTPADLKVKDIRGNIDTRLSKLHDGAYDAIILACAGLNRLGFQDRISAPLDFRQMLPAPGQGAIAVEARSDDSRIPSIGAALNDPQTAVAVSAERSFLQRMGGGCNVPVAVLAQLNGNQIEIEDLLHLRMDERL